MKGTIWSISNYVILWVHLCIYYWGSISEVYIQFNSFYKRATILFLCACVYVSVCMYVFFWEWWYMYACRSHRVAWSLSSSLPYCFLVTVVNDRIGSIQVTRGHGSTRIKMLATMPCMTSRIWTQLFLLILQVH